MSAVSVFWQGYLDSLAERHPRRLSPIPEAWSFGDSAEMADELGELVRQGVKTATCSRYDGGNALDDAGLNIILDGKNSPLCLIETYEIVVQPFSKVDAAFAFAEGEGDRSLDYWRNAHIKFFSREAKAEGYSFTEDMLLACERFRVLYPY